jgi:very-short-patch-repair endonuclease/succinate dehydrogenase flavin-adding protein (antitoxin of CptAB toxin-antitoxin module)
MSRQFAKSLRISMTDAEKHMWFLLRDRRLKGYKFRRQVPLGTYVVDFVCLPARLIVELDGGQHAEAVNEVARDAWLRSQAFTVLRFWNNDVLENTEGVLLTIFKHCETYPPHPYPSLAGRVPAGTPEPLDGRGACSANSPPRPARGEGSSRQSPERGAGKPDMENLRRLRWRCRRGLLELDVWLSRFTESRLADLSQTECGLLEMLLNEADADLLAWLQGRQAVPAEYEQTIADIRAAV